MSEYQWKLTIVERNLLLANWNNLMPEAQERMLEEADELMGELPLPDRQRLLTSLETLQDHTEGDSQHKINQILSDRSTHHIINALELSIQNHHYYTDSSTLMEPVH
jgi:hypothetical protein